MSWEGGLVGGGDGGGVVGCGERGDWGRGEMGLIDLATKRKTCCSHKLKVSNNMGLS